MAVNRVVQVLVVAVVIGVGSGIASGLFLDALTRATRIQADNPDLLYGLPLAGVAIAWLYGRYGKVAAGGNNLIINEIHQRELGVPLRMLPLVLVATVVTHLFGGSAGREGTAVQMGGALGGGLARRFQLDSELTRTALMCGISGGFSGVFGTPMAGTVFGMEMAAIGGLRYTALIPCLVAALVSHKTVLLLGIPHAHYAFSSTMPAFDVDVLLKVILAGIVFGVVSAAFTELTASIEHATLRILPNAYLRLATGGVVVIVVTLMLGTRLYNGLSLPLLAASFEGPVPTFAFAFKLLLTALTLGFGFKGGEVTPLFVIGATLGVTLAGPLALPPDFLAGMGFIAVFAAAANTPIACVVMGAELFGDGIVYFGITTFIAYTISGHRGIYSAQRIVTPKIHSIGTVSDGTTLLQLREDRQPIGAYLWPGRRSRRDEAGRVVTTAEREADEHPD